MHCDWGLTEVIIIIIIIIIMSCRTHGFPWLSLSICLYRPSHSAGHLDYIPCLHRDVVDSRTSNICWTVVSRMSCWSGLNVFRDGGRWPYSSSFVGCCFQDSFNMARSILVWLPSSFFSLCLVSVHVMYPYSSNDTITAWKKIRFILLDMSDFHMTDRQSIADHAFANRVLIWFSVDEMLLPR